LDNISIITPCYTLFVAKDIRNPNVANCKIKGLVKMIVKWLKDREKSEKCKVIVGALLLMGLFTGAYLLINNAAFVAAAEDQSVTVDDEYEYQIDGETIDYTDENQMDNEIIYYTDGDDGYSYGTDGDRELRYFQVYYDISLQDHYITGYEAEIIIAEEFLYKMDIELSAVDSVKSLTLTELPYHDEYYSIWFATIDYQINERDFHSTIEIDAETGQLVFFMTEQLPLNHYVTLEHNGISFVVSEDQRADDAGYLQPYMITREEAAMIAAEFAYEEFGMTMEGLRMSVELFQSDFYPTGYFWYIGFIPIDWDYPEGWIGQLPFIIFNAVTGEIDRYGDGTATSS